MSKLVYQENMPEITWSPSDEIIKTANITRLMKETGFENYPSLHRWSVENFPEFWEKMLSLLAVRFDRPYERIVDLSKGCEFPLWFPGAKLNIAKSCFQAAPSATAIISQNEKGEQSSISYGELDQLSNCIAENLRRYLNPGERAALIMPMTIKSVAIYLGILKAGCCVVPIVESFSQEEIAARINIPNAKLIFSQDFILRDGKKIPLYEKLKAASFPFTIVLPAEKILASSLRENDLSWENFLTAGPIKETVSCSPSAYTVILFSSGTTGDPKAIPWDHVTPIKCASDAYLYQNIQCDDVLCWPSNLGWMMGPWLIYAGLLNKACIALYEGTPNRREFGKFIQDKKITILGLVPSLVKNWRLTACMQGLDWSAIKVFSSSGECSNSDDMIYLMSLTNNKSPVIEYCGGTEIGGGYITSTVIQPNAPGAFNALALGLDLVILDEQGKETYLGEAALIPPSIGLSVELLNKDHHRIYYANMPRSASGKILRRHGDQLRRYENGFYRMYGRVDDTMNLSGIKVSSVEIEAVINQLPDIVETAAVPINPPGGGPSQLLIYVVLKNNEGRKDDQLKKDMQLAIKKHLNPLFKIHDIKIISALPRTGSNKILRRKLRNQDSENNQ